MRGAGGGEADPALQVGLGGTEAGSAITSGGASTFGGAAEGWAATDAVEVRGGALAGAEAPMPGRLTAGVRADSVLEACDVGTGVGCAGVADLAAGWEMPAGELRGADGEGAVPAPVGGLVPAVCGLVCDASRIAAITLFDTPPPFSCSRPLAEVSKCGGFNSIRVMIVSSGILSRTIFRTTWLLSSSKATSPSGA